EGFPGTVKAEVTYTLTDENSLKLDYHATTEKATPINLTKHSYFNLKGSGDVLGTELTIHANKYTPVDDTQFPTGIEPVKGTAFCLETQHCPDSINHPIFPSSVLRPRENYKQTTVYKFATRK